MIKKLLRKIFLNDFKKIEADLRKCINLFEIGMDVHIKEKSLIIIMRRDKQEIRFMECPDTGYIEHIIDYLKPFQNRIIDAEHHLRRVLHEELQR